MEHSDIIYHFDNDSHVTYHMLNIVMLYIYYFNQLFKLSLKMTFVQLCDLPYSHALGSGFCGCEKKNQVFEMLCHNGHVV